MAQKDGLLRIVQGLRRVDTGTYALRIRLAEKLGIGTIDINAMAFVGEGGWPHSQDLGKALNITTGSVTAMVDRLESKGFMVRKPNPTDRRSVLLHLSPEGTDAMQWGGTDPLRRGSRGPASGILGGQHRRHRRISRRHRQAADGGRQRPGRDGQLTAVPSGFGGAFLPESHAI